MFSSDRYATPGTVGYLPWMGALKTFHAGGAAPRGCAWRSYGLRCHRTNVRFDHYEIDAPVYWTGTGTFTVNQSRIDVRTTAKGGRWTGRPAGALASHAPTGLRAIVVTDSTITGTPPADQDIAAVTSDGKLVFTRSDFSGYPQGADLGTGSRVVMCVFHDFRQPDNQHMDGIFVQGSDVVIRQTYIKAPIRSDVTAAIFIQNFFDDTEFTGVRVLRSFISGGGFYALRNQSGTAVDVIGNTFGKGERGLLEGGTWGVWSGNTHRDGSPVPKP